MLRSNIFRGSVLIAGGSFLRVIFQAALLILVVRNLSLNDYGHLVALVSLIGMIFPVAAVGYEFELLRISSVDGDLLSTWRKFLYISFVSSAIFSLILIPLAFYLFGSHVGLLDIVLLLFSEMLSLRLLEGSNRIHQGHGQMFYITSSRLIFFGSRLFVVAVVLMMLGELTIRVYAVSCSLASCFSLFLIAIQLAKRENLYSGFQVVSWKEGLAQFPAALSFGCDRLTLNADKIFLEKLATPASAATYSVACRLMDIVTIPLIAIVTALQPEQLRRGGEINLLRISFIPVIYLLIITPLTFIFSGPLVLFFLGEKYLQASALLPFFLFLPFSSFLKYMLTTKAIAKCARSVMLLATLGSTLLNFILNIILIREYMAIGAVIALFFSEVFVILFLLIGLHGKKTN